MSTKGLMNQKQWISHDESQDKVVDVIKKINLYLISTPIVVSIVLGVIVGQFIIVPILGVIVGIALQRAVASSAGSAFAPIVESPLASETEHARVYNVVDGLCVVSGDQRPAVVIVDATYPVAVASLDDDGAHVIGVSQEFVNVMSRVEVEAVVAHLLWRLRVGHGRLVAYLLGLHRVLSMIGLGSIVQRLMSRMLPAEIVSIADIAACQATRFPPAAISALEKCAASTGVAEMGAGDFLSFALPRDGEGATGQVHKVSNLEVTRLPLSERVAILKEM